MWRWLRVTGYGVSVVVDGSMSCVVSVGGEGEVLVVVKFVE